MLTFVNILSIKNAVSSILFFFNKNIGDVYSSHINYMFDIKYSWLFYIPVINILIMFVVGRYILSAIMYPYQNSIIRETLDRNNAKRFGEEFSHYLDSFIYTLRI